MNSKKLIFLSIFILAPLFVFGQELNRSYLRFDRYIPSSDVVIVDGVGYFKNIFYEVEEGKIKSLNFAISVVHEDPTKPDSKEWRILNVIIPLLGNPGYDNRFLKMARGALWNDVFVLSNLPLKNDLKTIRANDISEKNFRLNLPVNHSISEGIIEAVDPNKNLISFLPENWQTPINIKYGTTTKFASAIGEVVSPETVLQPGNKVLIRYRKDLWNFALRIVLLEKSKPLPQVRIISLPRTQEIRVAKAGGTIIERFQFSLENFPEDSKDFTLRFNFSHTLLKDIKLELEGVSPPTVGTRMGYLQDFPITLPSANGTFTVKLMGTVRDYQDQDYPYLGGLFKIEFISVKPVKEMKYKLEGKDVSHTYAIHVPYYPNTSTIATVGADEFPALVLYQNPDTKEVGIYFTSFNERFNGIHVGLQHPNGQRKEIVKDCQGTCSKNVDQLIKQFGHPSAWGFLILKFKPERTVQYRGYLTLERCYGTLYFDLSKLTNNMMVCFNRKAFGNNYGWGRLMKANISWSYQPTTYQYAEKLNYEFILPRDIDQHFPPPPRMKQILKEEDLRLLLQILSNILLQLK